MNNYDLYVTSGLYKKKYTIESEDLVEASKIAKLKFGKEYGIIGSKVKVSLDSGDLVNHIDEILQKLYK